MAENFDRDVLLKNFVDAALNLMERGLSDLSPEKAVLVSHAQRGGADVCLVFSPGAGTVVGALNLPGSDVDPAMLFQIVIPSPEAATN